MKLPLEIRHALPTKQNFTMIVIFTADRTWRIFMCRKLELNTVVAGHGGTQLDAKGREVKSC